MSYQVFARKYRPRTFKDVLGQEHVVRTLCNAIEQKRLAHAYLFVGPRGTGKTSTARIFAKALNCTGGPRVDFDPDEDVCREIAEGTSLDVLEIDGASNRGIDNIRDLRDNVQFTPTRGQYRIIYIDEVHMLTKESFNALLKTLEEPPEHVMFIFATTEPHKILPTILSRCQRFDLRPIPADVIAKHLIHIAGLEGVRLSEEAAYAIAGVADGGMRDAQSMLDQLVSFCGNEITERNVNEIFGITGRETVARAVSYLLGRQLPSLLHLVHDLSEAGRDMGQFLVEMMGTIRELLVAKVAPQESSTAVPPAWREPLLEYMARIPLDKVMSLMEALSVAEERMRWSTNKRLHLELGIIQAVHCLAQANISDIIKALNGAPLPETPIATELLPDIARPSAEQPEEPLAQSNSLSQADAPPPQQPDSSDAPESALPSLPPIDDEPPDFSKEGSAPEEAKPQALGGISAELWEQAVQCVRAKSPLKAGLIGSTLFVGEENGLATIAIHPGDTASRDALLSDEVGLLVCEQLRASSGVQVERFRIVTDESVPAPAADEVLPAPAANPAARKISKKVTPQVEEAPAEEQKSPISEHDFYEDPLIELALRELEAQIIPQS